MNFIQTNAVMYRRLAKYDDIPPGIMPLDWYLHVRHAVHGDIGMLPDTMAVYRRHREGAWHDRVANPAKFWVRQGPGHAAMFEAMLAVLPEDRRLEEIIAAWANWVLRQIASVPGPEGRATFERIIVEHPRFATLALRNSWETPPQRLKALGRRLAAVAPTRKGLVDVWPPRVGGTGDLY